MDICMSNVTSIIRRISQCEVLYLSDIQLGYMKHVYFKSKNRKTHMGQVAP